MRFKLNNNGFTLVELMLAMGLFSVILIVSTAGFIGINRVYTRGIVKKQLSESVQKIGTDATSVVRIEPSTTVQYCDEADGQPSCPSSAVNAVCFAGARYYWPSLLDPNDGGMYKDNESCNSDTFNRDFELVDSRYTVEDFQIVQLTNGLFQIKGVIHTRDLGALTINGNSDDYQASRATPGYDPYKTKCKGSAAGSVVQTCAVESFDFVVNSRGNI